MREMKSKVLTSFIMASLVFLLFQVEGYAAVNQLENLKQRLRLRVKKMKRHTRSR